MRVKMTLNSQELDGRLHFIRRKFRLNAPLRVSTGTEAPDGYKIVEEECPDVDTEEQQKTLIGQYILHAWDSKTGTQFAVDDRALLS